MPLFLDIRPGEGRRLLPLATVHALVLASVYVLKPVRNALFLDRLGVGQLPYVLILVAVVGGVAAALFGRLSRAVRVERLIVGTYGFLAASLLLFHLLLDLDTDWVCYAFYVWVNLVGLLAGSLLWLLANAVFNAREARRLFGFIQTGGIAGAIVGGFFTGWAAGGLGTENLLFVCAGVLAVCAGIVGRVKRKSDAAPRHRDVGPAGAEDPGFRRTPLLRLLAITGGITAVVAAIVDVLFNQIAAAAFPTKDAKTAFFGEFFAWLNAFCLLFQLFVTPRVLGRFGVAASLSLLPAATAAGSLGALFLPGLAGGVAVKIGDIGFRHSIHKSALELLYLPVPAALKRRSKVFLDTTVDNVATGLGAGLVLLLTWGLGLGYRQLSYASLALVSLWCVLILRTRHAYIDAFRRALDRREINTADVRADLSVGDLHGALLDTLRSDNTRKVLYALQTLGSMGASIDGARIAPLLRHAAPPVRREALRLLAEAREPALRGDADRLLDDPDPGVRIEAVHALSRRDGGTARLLGWLRGGDPARRVAALGSVALYGTLAERAAIDEALIRDVAGGSAAERAAAARAIGLLGDARLVPVLEALAEDGDPSVAREAVAAAGRLRLAAFVPWIARCLADGRLRADARAALIRLGDAAVPALDAVLKDARSPERLRGAAASVLGGIATPEAAAVLVDALDRAPGLEFAVVKALNKLRLRAPAMPLAPARLETAFRRRTEAHYVLCHAHRLGAREAAAPPSLRLLERALREKVAESLETSFRLLGLLYPARDMYHAYLGAQSRSRAVRASAVEFLDNLLEKGHKDLLVPFLDSQTLDAALEAGHARYGQKFWSLDEAVAYLMQGADPWLRACAVSVVGARRSADLRRLAVRRQNDPSPVVAEAARRVISSPP